MQDFLAVGSITNEGQLPEYVFDPIEYGAEITGENLARISQPQCSVKAFEQGNAELVF